MNGKIVEKIIHSSSSLETKKKKKSLKFTCKQNDTNFHLAIDVKLNVVFCFVLSEHKSMQLQQILYRG